MAKPRVFVSSTYYDLKHVRSSLDLFIESLGFEPVLSEKGDVAFTSDIPLDESCYREAGSADILILIIGGRYGTEASGPKREPKREFFERYESITKKEYESAASRDIPIYILVEHNVHAEYQTYLRNRDNAKINYAHVDSVNIFAFIEEILSKPRNNPVHTFERFSEVESWLRDQWAGLFRELLQRQSQQQQLSALSTQIEQLTAINESLRRYLEAIIKTVSPTPDASRKIIETEKQRLQEDVLKANHWVQHIQRRFPDVPFKKLGEAIAKATSIADYVTLMEPQSKMQRSSFDILTKSKAAFRDFNLARAVLGVPPLEFEERAENEDSDPKEK